MPGTGATGERSAADMRWRIVDGIGPFFVGYDRPTINWSKIPFSHVETPDGAVDRARFARIREDVRRFCGRAAEEGFNAITFDDLAHLTPCTVYPRPLQDRIAAYREEFGRIFGLAEAAGLRVFVTTDVMFFHPALDAHLADRPGRIRSFLRRAAAGLLEDFPQVEGLILRAGEADASDTESDFRSRLTLRRPEEARACLRALLPEFEARNRTLVFRTWSVGAHPIGDLIWNRTTFLRVFRGLDSPNLVLSMKHGESDFFRFLPANPLFFATDHAKIVEMQARREYEGFGEYPSFVGAEVTRLRDELSRCRNLVGICLWVQTGGWGPFRRLTWLDTSSPWNEINATVSLRVFHGGETPEQAVAAWVDRYRPDLAPAPLFRLLALSEEAVRETLYIGEFARRKVFFRRLRVPPLLWVFWDQVIVNHWMRKAMRLFVTDGDAAVREGWAGLAKVRALRDLARGHGLPQDGLGLMHDTFHLLCVAREYLFWPFDEVQVQRLLRLRREYEATHRPGYQVHLSLRRVRIRRTSLRRLLAVILRGQRGYRWVDRLGLLLGHRLLGPVLQRRVAPRFARDRAMGIDAVLR